MPTSGQPEPVSQEDVAFYCDGLRLTATVHRPAGQTPAPGWPAVVVCNGFGASKDLVAPDIADRIAAAGIMALRFDYRGFGQSEGRYHHMIPQEQVEDARAAVTYFESRDDVDDEAIGVYGTSFGGAHAISLAGTDTRVRAIVSVVPVGDGRRWMRSLRRNWEWNSFCRRLHEDRMNHVRTGESEWVDSDEIMVPDPHADAWHQEIIAQFPERKYSLPLETANRLLDYSPQSVVAQIAPRPLLLIHVVDDDLVPTDETEQLYAAAGEAKRKVLLSDMHHHDIYAGAPFETVMSYAIPWLRAGLMRGPETGRARRADD
ncbi:MAG: alpha/beta fold hydrolase [Propionibacteriales bacterium]|nr:alpha/beta fold hydrolase [Propionibacteriales bacterium]